MDPAVTAKMADTKALGEVKALEAFYTTLQTEPAKAFYGTRHVEAANEAQAIETLLISDNLFRYITSSNYPYTLCSIETLYSLTLYFYLQVKVRPVKSSPT